MPKKKTLLNAQTVKGLAHHCKQLSGFLRTWNGAVPDGRYIESIKDNALTIHRLRLHIHDHPLMNDGRPRYADLSILRAAFDVLWNEMGMVQLTRNGNTIWAPTPKNGPLVSSDSITRFEDATRLLELLAEQLAMTTKPPSAGLSGAPRTNDVFRKFVLEQTQLHPDWKLARIYNAFRTKHPTHKLSTGKERVFDSKKFHGRCETAWKRYRKSLQENPGT